MPLLWDYLKTLIMLRLTLQAPCMCAGYRRGRQALVSKAGRWAVHSLRADRSATFSIPGPLTDFAAGALSETSGIAMPRAKKHPKLSADERAFHNRLDCLNEEEIKQLTTREIFAYFKIIDKVDSRADVRRMVERAK
jgi:hypothetical protein